MKKNFFSCLLIVVLLFTARGICVEAAADELFDYSPLEKYEAESFFYSFEIDKSDSQWSSYIMLDGNEGILRYMFYVYGDLDGNFVGVLGIPRVTENTDLTPEKLQIQVDNTVYTITGEFLQEEGGFFLYGENGGTLLKALISADEFSVRIQVGNMNYDDAFTKDDTWGYNDFIFMGNEAIRQDALGKISAELSAELENYLLITIKDEVFDYSSLETYEAESSLYSFEIDEFDSEWKSYVILDGNKATLRCVLYMSGDLDGTSVSIVGVPKILEDSDLKLEKLQFLIDDDVYTMEGSFLTKVGCFYFYGENGTDLLKALASTDEFFVRMEADGVNYNDTYAKDSTLGYNDFIFMGNEIIRQDALERISSETVAGLERSLSITVE